MTRPIRSLEHGEYGFARREKCHCEPCRAACRAYQKRRDYDAVIGNLRRVDAAPARDHVQQLLDAGVTYHQIAAATEGKVFQSQIRNLIEGNAVKEVSWIYPHTEDALFEVTYDKAMARSFTFVPAVGVHRRLQALRRAGYNLQMIADRLGITYSAVYRYMLVDRVRTTTLDAVTKVYDEMHMTTGPDEREMWIAYRRDWPPAMAWDDETIDNPNAEPDMSSVVCIVAKCTRSIRKMGLCDAHFRRVAERNVLDRPQRFREAVTRLDSRQAHGRDLLIQQLTELREMGYTPVRAAQRLKRSQEYIEKVWKETA